MKANYLLEF